MRKMWYCVDYWYFSKWMPDSAGTNRCLRCTNAIEKYTSYQIKRSIDKWHTACLRCGHRFVAQNCVTVFVGRIWGRQKRVVELDTLTTWNKMSCVYHVAISTPIRLAVRVKNVTRCFWDQIPKAGIRWTVAKMITLYFSTVLTLDQMVQRGMEVVGQKQGRLQIRCSPASLPQADSPAGQVEFIG